MKEESDVRINEVRRSEETKYITLTQVLMKKEKEIEGLL